MRQDRVRKGLCDRCGVRAVPFRLNDRETLICDPVNGKCGEFHEIGKNDVRAPMKPRKAA